LLPVARLNIRIALTVLAVVSIAMLTVACGGSNDKAPSGHSDLPSEALDVAPTTAPSAQAQPQPTAPPLAQATQTQSPPEPAPEPPPPENRADCNAIRGTDYRSLEERTWFVENCTRTATSGAAAGAGGAGPGGGQSPTGDRLLIPAAGVNAEVWRASVPASGVMPDPVGYFNALAYDFSAIPGLGGGVDSGNLVMAGHVDCGRCYNGGAGTAVFWSVRNLKPGDTAQYRTADGRVVNYVVTSSRSLGGGTDGLSIVASGAADMTLITCTGSFSGGEYNLRHVVAFRKA
jgi:hypothetical protein